MDIPPIDSQIRRGTGSRPEPRDFGSVEWVVAEGNPPGAEQMLGIAVFAAGGSNAEHTHPNCEEIVFVLEGAIEHTLGDQSTVLRAGDVLVAPRHVPHRIINHGPAPCRMLIVFSSPDRSFVPTGR